MVAMEGMGAIPAVAVSNVSAVMPCANAVLRASARNASNVGLPEPGWAGGGAGFVTEAGGGGGADLGGGVAQAATRRPPHRAASRFRPVREGERRNMGDWYTGSVAFSRKSWAYCHIRRV